MFEILFGLLGKWYIWAPIALVLGYLAVRNNQRAKAIRNLEHILLAIELPQHNTKAGPAAEELFNSLHGILRNRRELATQGGLQEHISFEVVATATGVRFYAWVPTFLRNFVEGQIYAQYPNVRITVADNDYASQNTPTAAYVTELALTQSQLLPIKTYSTFNNDPLSAITTAMGQVQPEEEAWLQVLVRPTTNDWHSAAGRAIARLKSGRASSLSASAGQYFLDFLEAMWRPPQQKGTPEPSERAKAQIELMSQKCTKPGFRVKVRLAYVASSESTAKLRLQAIASTFQQFNRPQANNFTAKKGSFATDALAEYQARFFIDKGLILNSEELATVFHLPYTDAKEEPSDAPQTAAAPTPSLIPILGSTTDGGDTISAFGLTAEVTGTSQQFGIYRDDRSRHVYVIGQTGTGKTALLELLALSDVFHKQGYAIIDPHGDFATNNLRYIPASRAKDVVYFNPADTAHPIGFNPMEVINPNMKSTISSEVIGVLKRMFGDSWGPRLEHILRFTLLALLDYPNATLLDITRMLTDKRFRETVLQHCNDAVVRQFWYGEFATWNDKFAAEAIAPVLNKVGAFTANPIIRNIIGQPKSTFNIRKLMDEGKILIVNLSRGLIGEDNAAILGAFMVTKIQLAAMSRSDIPRVEDRKPFYLYVDEFQNFATDSFATILSEARKYGLCLTVANQYVSQMAPGVRDAVFGNVGTLISFRLSANDAPVLAKHYAPQFNSVDLMQQHSRHFLASMVVKDQKIAPFAGTTLNLPPVQADISAQIIENTRRQHATPRADVEQRINQTIGQQHYEPAGRGRAHAQHWTSKKPVHQPAQHAGPSTIPNNDVVFKLRG